MVSDGIGVRERKHKNKDTGTIRQVFLMKTRLRAPKKRTLCVRFLSSFLHFLSLTPIDALHKSLYPGTGLLIFSSTLFLHLGKSVADERVK